MLSALGQGRDVAVGLAAGALLCAVARTSVSVRETRQLAATRRMALTDELTGLANRRALDRALEAEVAASRPVALLLFDLDRFKELNDALGHPTGDALLRRIGPRLAGLLRPQDVLARLGGDEFAVALRGPVDEHAALAVAERLRAALEQPFDLGIAAYLDASFGVALYPEHAGGAADLLARADSAMYRAKRERSGVEVDAAGHDVRRPTPRQPRRAIDRGELELHVQPLVAPATGAVASAEALARWHHPQHGLLFPGEFLPEIERTPLMRSFTDCVIADALRWQRAWAAAGLDVPVAVNLAAVDLLDRDLPERVTSHLAAAGASSARLRLEVTETAVMTDAERARGVLAELRALGVGLALDEFGSGSASLAMLKRLPVDQVKLDRVFASGVVEDARDAAIVAATLSLRDPFGVTVVAVGAESPAALAALGGAGCDLVQGFAIARPMPAGELPRWAADRFSARTLYGPQHAAS